jgi:hypothetical protein
LLWRARLLTGGKLFTVKELPEFLIHRCHQLDGFI